jgi:hypothetical protein
MTDSTNRPGRKAYDELIKVGDAVETPDGELWVVTGVGYGDEPVLALASACRGSDERIYADAYEATQTALPAGHVTKVADARRVRR